MTQKENLFDLDCRIKSGNDNKKTRPGNDNKKTRPGNDEKKRARQ